MHGETTSMKAFDNFLFTCSMNVLIAISVQGSQKKGMAVSRWDILCDDFKVFDNISWWYDWGIDLSAYHKTVRARCPYVTETALPEYVPMVWTYHPHRVLNISSNAKYVLGFNEPDNTMQANLTPQQAVIAWHEVENNSHEKHLVSPSTASHSAEWFDTFYNLCINCRIDYIAAHIYRCDAHQVIKDLKRLNERYNKKIWLTELACPYSTDEQKQLHLMEVLLPMLETADYVFRYSWFMTRIKHVTKDGFITPAASLLYRDSSKLTTIGQFYNNFDGSKYS